MVDLKKPFLDMYFRYVQGRANRRSDKVRQLQQESGRTDMQVIRIIVYNDDVRASRAQQSAYMRTFRVRDGVLEYLDDRERPDAVILSDFPTIYGIANGRYVQVFPDGTRKVHENFGAFDALRLGKMECEGDQSVLSNLYLFERRVAPEILKEIRLPPPAR
jgi:hypothetical protein